MKLAQPDNMPERLESGTLNNVGIIGLCAGIDFVVGKSVSSIYKHEKILMKYITANLRKIIMLRYILQALMMLFLRRYCRLTIKIIRRKKQPLFWLIRILHAVQAFIVQSLLILHLVLTIEELYV